MYAQARNGGSITPRYRKILDAHIASGKILLHTHTTLESVNWDEASNTWNSVVTEPAIPMPSIDYIVFATGVQTDVETIPFLQSIVKRYPIETIGGLPCLNDDLMWNDEVPMFAAGRLAGLRLGPGAPNLVGARIGAERIAWNVEDVLKKSGRTSRKGVYGDVVEDTDSSGDDFDDYAAARDNRFNSLVGVSE